MEAYLRVFVNYKENNWIRLLLMAEFTYNNTKNTSISHTPFEFNYGYHSCVFYKKHISFCFKSKLTDELSINLRELITVYTRKNLHHAQKLWKQAYDKAINPKSYAASNKVLLNNNYIKAKQNCKFETKFFEYFQVLHPIKNQDYKLELLKKEKIYDVFLMSLLEYDIIRKKRVDKTTIQLKFEAGDNGKEYEVKEIWDYAVYTKKLKNHLPSLYYLVL